jgi:membrane-bound ClpP family serine protease
MSPLLWIVMLLVVGLTLIILEVFIPSGGVLGLLSVLALGAGVITAFVEQGSAAGMTVLAGTFVAVPMALAAAFRWFPATPLGRRVLPPLPAAADVVPDPAERRQLREYLGERGRTRSELLPWGSVELAGETLEAVSDEGPIPPGATVEVTGVQGRAVVVRRVAAPAVARPVPAAEPPAGVLPVEPTAPRISSMLEEFDFEEVQKNTAASDELDSPSSPNQA